MLDIFSVAVVLIRAKASTPGYYRSGGPAIARSVAPSRLKADNHLNWQNVDEPEVKFRRRIRAFDGVVRSGPLRGLCWLLS